MCIACMLMTTTNNNHEIHTITLYMINAYLIFDLFKMYEEKKYSDSHKSQLINYICLFLNRVLFQFVFDFCISRERNVLLS